MRTLACIAAATTAAVSMIAAGVEPAHWPLPIAIAVAVLLVLLLAVVQWRGARRTRLPGRHSRVPGAQAQDAEREAPTTATWHGFADETLTTGEIDVHPGAGTTAVRVPAAVPAAVPVRRAIRNVDTDPFLAVVPEQAAASVRAPWQYWTPALDRRLLSLFDDGTSTAEIAIRMRRDRDTVDARLVQLLVDAGADLEDEPTPVRHREPMPDAEAAYLSAAQSRGESLRRMARAVGRTQREVGRYLVEQRRLTVR
jgi:hypothetical protein